MDVRNNCKIISCGILKNLNLQQAVKLVNGAGCFIAVQKDYIIQLMESHSSLLSNKVLKRSEKMFKNRKKRKTTTKHVMCPAKKLRA